MKLVLLVMLAALMTTACEETREPPDRVVLGQTVDEQDGCPDQETIVSDGSLALEETLEGDVNGDQVSDVVKLHVEAGGDTGCAAFVVVDIPSGLASEPVWQIGREGGLPQPRLNSLAQIDGKGGLEILVDEIAGASTQFVGAFTFVDGPGGVPHLERIQPAEPVEDVWSGASEGVFPYGGSVGHVEAVDCGADGEIVVSVALPGDSPSKIERGIYSVTRRFFRVEGAELLATKTEEKEVEFDFGKTYPEFGSSPFGSCPSA